MSEISRELVKLGFDLELVVENLFLIYKLEFRASGCNWVSKEQLVFRNSECKKELVN